MIIVRLTAATNPSTIFRFSIEIESTVSILFSWRLPRYFHVVKKAKVTDAPNIPTRVSVNRILLIVVMKDASPIAAVIAALITDRIDFCQFPIFDVQSYYRNKFKMSYHIWWNKKRKVISLFHDNVFGIIFIGVFAIASRLYVTVNFAPLSVWYATALPTKSPFPDGTGFDECMNCSLFMAILWSFLGLVASPHLAP
jgi:hypothetical protein